MKACLVNRQLVRDGESPLTLRTIDYLHYSQAEFEFEDDTCSVSFNIIYVIFNIICLLCSVQSNILFNCTKLYNGQNTPFWQTKRFQITYWVMQFVCLGDSVSILVALSRLKSERDKTVMESERDKTVMEFEF